MSTDPCSLEQETAYTRNRRHFLAKTSLGLGGVALGSLLIPRLFEDEPVAGDGADELLRGVLGSPHFAPRARRVIYLFQSGGPSQLELFDYKPLLRDRNGEELPDEVRDGQRLTGMTSNQDSFPLAGSQWFICDQLGDRGRHQGSIDLARPDRFAVLVGLL